jgi:hypothetical protein
MNGNYVAIIFVLANAVAAPAIAAATNSVPRQPQSADGKVVKFDRVGTMEKVDVDTGDVVISGQKFKAEPRVTKALGVDGRSIDFASLKPGGLVGARFGEGTTGTPFIVELKQLEKAKP